MTGLEKFAIAAVLSSTVSMTQITISNTGTLFGIGWTIIGAVLATGVTYGMTRQRLTALEEAQKGLATKDAVDALHDKLDTVTRMLDSRIIDRRQG